MSDRRGIGLARRLGGWLRDGWLVLGATLALLVVIELAYRDARTYFPLHSLFDRDTATVFIDHFGHVTERANGVIADRAVELVAPLLASAP